MRKYDSQGGQDTHLIPTPSVPTSARAGSGVENTVHRTYSTTFGDSDHHTYSTTFGDRTIINITKVLSYRGSVALYAILHDMHRPVRVFNTYPKCVSGGSVAKSGCAAKIRRLRWNALIQYPVRDTRFGYCTGYTYRPEFINVSGNYARQHRPSPGAPYCGSEWARSGERASTRYNIGFEHD